MKDRLDELTDQLIQAHDRSVEVYSRYEALVAGSPQAIVEIDPDGIVTRWNASATAMFGWPTQEAAGRRLTEFLIPEKYREHHLKALEAVKTSGRPRGYLYRKVEVPVCCKDGSTRHAVMVVAPVVVAPIGMEDSRLHFVGFLWPAGHDKAVSVDTLLTEIRRVNGAV